ncbi:Hypothetical protein A7982_00800 [Minicystis rosea]|nr:Hypothetical protein A7982_00800 [Minicystis rosea]
MRTSAIWTVLGLCGALTTTACSNMKAIQKEVAADLKQAQSIQKQVEAVKKGDVGAAGDATLSVAVKGALEKDAALKGQTIEVEVKSGVVHLKGNTTAEAKTHAEKVAKGVTGVTKVVNELKAPGSKDAKDKDDDDKPTRAKTADKDDKNDKDKNDKPTRASKK